MTMSLVGKPATMPIRAADDPSAPSIDPSTAEGFAGIVAAIVAGDQATATVPVSVPATTVPTPAAVATLPIAATAIDGAPKDKVTDESDAAPSADPAALPVALAAAPVAGPVFTPDATTAATVAIPVAQGTGPVATVATDAAPAGIQPDATSSPEAGSGAGSHASRDGGGAAPTQPVIAPTPTTVAAGKAGSVADTLTAGVAKIVAAKTSDSPEAPTAAAGQVTPPTVPTNTTAAVAPTVPGTPAGTAAQLAPAVFAVHRRGVEGTHHMTVDITPDELGPVRLTVALRDGQMHVLLAGSSEVSREAMRAALPELRRLVEGAGITAGSFDVHPDQPDTTGRFGAGTSGSSRDSSLGGSGSSPDHPPSHPGQPDRAATASPERRGLLAASRSLDLHL